MTPPGERLRVHCCDSSHETKVVTVVVFVRRDDEWAYWMPTNARGASVVDPVGYVVNELDANDTPVFMDFDTGEPERPVVRFQHQLDCRLCGLNLSARHERLTPILDRLAAASIDGIELAHLLALYTRTTKVS